MSLDKCVRTCIHQYIIHQYRILLFYRILEYITTALKVICAKPVHTSLLVPLNPFIVSMVLLFLQCHIIVI